MKKLCCCLLVAITTLFYNSIFAQLNADRNRGGQISLINGLNNFANKSSNDSVYFLKSGINLGVQGNYFWKNIGIAGRLGYFTNNTNEDRLSDFGLSRKAARDRMLIASRPYKGYYWMAGPAFQTSFNRWQVESNMLGGMFHNDDAGVFIGDRVSPDLVYYRNKVEAGSSFAWNVGLGINYSISTLIRLGVTADYLSTQSEVMNTDINRNGGTTPQQISSQANFLSTALKLTYSLSRNSDNHRNDVRKSTVNNSNSDKAKKYFETGDKPTEPQRTTSDCDCENKTMEIAFLEPQKIDITFISLQEAQDFLKTTNPMYKDNGMSGVNPMYDKREAGSGMATGRRQYKPIMADYDDLSNSFEINGKYYVATARDAGSGMATGRRSLATDGAAEYVSNENDANRNEIAIDESGVHRGTVLRIAGGEQVFAVFPATVNLFRISTIQGGAISVHVKNDNDTSEMQQRKWRNNNTVRSNRTNNALISNDNNNGNEGGLDIVLFTDAAGKTSASVFKNSLKNFFEKGDIPTAQQREAGSGMATGRRNHKPMTVMFDEDNGVIDINGTAYYEVKTARDAGSGMATGKRVLPTVNKRTLPIRIAAGDDNTAKAIVTNNTTRGGSATLNSQSSTTRQTQGASFGEKSSVATGAGAGAGAACMPGDPIPGLDVKLFRVSDATEYTAYTNDQGFIEIDDNLGAGEYELRSIYKGKWNKTNVAVKISSKDANDDAAIILLKADTDGDGVMESHLSTYITKKAVEKATSGIKQTMQTQVFAVNNNDDNNNTDNPGTVKKTFAVPHVLEKSGTYKISCPPNQPIRCTDGSCIVSGTITMNGVEYPAQLTVIIKSSHDMQMGAIRNLK